MDSKRIYRRSYGLIWICWSCRAWVSCRANGTPRGPLANAELRSWRRRAHLAFDRLWRTPEERTEAYTWLSQQMRVHPQACHIAQFNKYQCETAIELCHKLREDHDA